MSAMNISLEAEYEIGGTTTIRPRVKNEEGVREQANTQLHYLVVEMLGILGIELKDGSTRRTLGIIRSLESPTFLGCGMTPSIPGLWYVYQ
jgi:hypothetical protein